jgi:hypothetical protein
MRLIESESFKTVSVKEISPQEKTIIENFVSMLKITYNFFKKGKDYTRDIKEYEQYKRDVSPYLKEPWAGPVRKRIEQINKELTRINIAKKTAPRHLESLSKDIKKLETMFHKKDFGGGAAFSRNLNRKLNSLNTFNKSPEKELAGYRNPLYKADPIIFEPSGLIRSFEYDEMETLINKDYNSYKYSYLNFPTAKLKDFEWLVYFIQKLQNTSKKVELSYGLYNKWIDFLYINNEDFSKLKNIVDNYLHSGDKKLIPDILNQLKNYPELNKTNEKLKKQHKMLYRGIGGYNEKDEPTEKEIKAAELKSKYVATTTSKHVAMSFAKMIGHLESGRRSDWGYIIWYSVTPAAIILDTAIFGSIYGESEVLIDVTKATIREIESIGYKGEEDED